MNQINPEQENPVFTLISKQISDNDVVLYMKGMKQIPQCGFSAVVVDILEQVGVEDFLAVNVLENQEIREGIKQYTDWPTIPQLYIKGEFVGGCDIIREMYSSGELQQILQEKAVL